MKLVIGLALGLMSFSALAFDPSEEGSGDAFILCSGYHHGTYLEFYTNEDGTKVAIETSNDGDLGEGQQWPLYQITKITKGQEVVDEGNYVQVLNEVVEVMASEPGSKVYEYVEVRAEGQDKNEIILNLNNFFGESYLVIDGFVEPLTCTPPTVS